MKSTILRKRFMDTAVGDVLRAVDGRAVMGSTALALCVLDFLAYLRPRTHKGNADNYRQLVTDYLVDFDPRYDPEEIYALRCAMLHTHGEADATADIGMTDFTAVYGEPASHLARTAEGVVLNMDSFVADVIWAAHRFFVDRNGDVAVEQNADKLFKVHSGREGMVAVYDPDAEMEECPYGALHRALRELDSASPDREALRMDVAAIYPGGADAAMLSFPGT